MRGIMAARLAGSPATIDTPLRCLSQISEKLSELVLVLPPDLVSVQGRLSEIAANLQSVLAEVLHNSRVRGDAALPEERAAAAENVAEDRQHFFATAAASEKLMDSMDKLDMATKRQVAQISEQLDRRQREQEKALTAAKERAAWMLQKQRGEKLLARTFEAWRQQSLKSKVQALRGHLAEKEQHMMRMELGQEEFEARLLRERHRSEEMSCREAQVSQRMMRMEIGQEDFETRLLRERHRSEEMSCMEADVHRKIMKMELRQEDYDVLLQRERHRNEEMSCMEADVHRKIMQMERRQEDFEALLHKERQRNEDISCREVEINQRMMRMEQKQADFEAAFHSRMSMMEQKQADVDRERSDGVQRMQAGILEKMSMMEQKQADVDRERSAGVQRMQAGILEKMSMMEQKQAEVDRERSAGVQHMQDHILEKMSMMERKQETERHSSDDMRNMQANLLSNMSRLEQEREASESRYRQELEQQARRVEEEMRMTMDSFAKEMTRTMEASEARQQELVHQGRYGTAPVPVSSPPLPVVQMWPPGPVPAAPWPVPSAVLPAPPGSVQALAPAYHMQLGQVEMQRVEEGQKIIGDTLPLWEPTLGKVDRPGWLPFEGPGNRNVLPEEWGMTIRQFCAFIMACFMGDSAKGGGSLSKFATWDKPEELKHAKMAKFVSLYDITDSFVKPWTRNLGNSIALLMNNKKPLKAQVMISHAWGEDIIEAMVAILGKISAMGMPLDTAMWFCAFAQYQPGDLENDCGPGVKEQLEKDPFKRVIDSNPPYGMLVIHTSRAELYGRLWCVYEVNEAISAKVPSRAAVSMNYLLEYHERIGRGWTKEELCSVSTKQAVCYSVDDMRMIKEKIQGKHGFQKLDDTIFDFRTDALDGMLCTATGFAEWAAEVHGSDSGEEAVRTLRDVVRTAGIWVALHCLTSECAAANYRDPWYDDRILNMARQCVVPFQWAAGLQSRSPVTAPRLIDPRKACQDDTVFARLLREEQRGLLAHFLARLDEFPLPVGILEMAAGGREAAAPPVVT